MDKSWINRPKLDPKHIEGWIDFLNFATNNQPNEGIVIACPCRKCKNVRRKTIKIVKGHLANGFLASYTNWIFHGEASKHAAQQSDQRSKDGHDEMQEMLYDAFGIIPSSLVNEMTNNTISHGPDEETGNFFKLLKEAERELYPGCKGMSLLSFVVQLLHLKCLYGWSNESFTKLLNFFKKCLPEGEIVPKSFGASRKLLNGLGLDYHKVHACPGNCMLYWGENIDRVDCKVCKRPRYKQYEVEANESNISRNKVPEKIVRYFPLIPRLKQLFMSSKTASLMTWQADNPAPDGVMRHPVDSAAWKYIDHLYPNFAQEPRNIRLGLASDGFNPFRTMSISHSTWSVVLMTYNLLHWLCMKQPYMMLSLLIDGPKAPGNDIDVYLSLIVDELKLLWDNDVQTYDAARDEMFQMRGVLLCLHL